MNVPEWLINFFAGLGMLTALLAVGGIVIALAINKRADQEED